MAQNQTRSVTEVTNSVSIIVPARNEEAGLERCLRSLVEQQGIPFELIVVDDGSTDRTPEIIKKFAGVRECPFLGVNPSLIGVTAMNAGPVPQGWTGKAHAVWQAAQKAQGDWLLFTDADTVHERGSLAAAVDEAKQQGAALLSYSPKQELRGLGERIVMPLVFGELASRFRPKDVSDPNSKAAAANGQYLLIRRDAYFGVGGHQAVAGDLLEDVALAKLVKQAGGKLHFRFGGDRVRARMYRSWSQLVEGWTKNLALLFPDARSLAWRRLSEFAAIGFFALADITADVEHKIVIGTIALILFVGFFANFLVRVRRSHCGGFNEVLSILGLPFFSRLLLRSAYMHERGRVAWKGRVYSGSESTGTAVASDALVQPKSPVTSTQESHGISHPKV
jgi:GT2 family glycosyltransferase